jgi:tRNA threonylcarbamoyladenosine biosynthesis protein TsaE
VKQVASILGITEQIQSPTFVLERRYAVPHGQQFDTLVHIDAYRLNGADELRRIRWDETRSNSGNIIFLEWPEQVQGAIPDDAITLTFQIIDEQTRVITTT